MGRPEHLGTHGAVLGEALTIERRQQAGERRLHGVVWRGSFGEDARFISRWMDKPKAGHAYSGILFSPVYATTGMSLEDVMLPEMCLSCVIPLI